MQLKLKDHYAKFLEILGKPPEEPLRALSIRQPWAWLVANGHKEVENRTWATAYRGPLLVHASTYLHEQGFRSLQVSIQRGQGITTPDAHQLDFGGFVGIGLLKDCLMASKSKWFNGPFGFLIENAAPLQFIPYRGRLGLFTVPDLTIEGDL